MKLQVELHNSGGMLATSEVVDSEEAAGAAVVALVKECDGYLSGGDVIYIKEVDDDRH